MGFNNGVGPSKADVQVMGVAAAAAAGLLLLTPWGAAGAGVVGLVSGVVMFVAALLVHDRWRERPDPREARLVATMAVGALGVLVSAVGELTVANQDAGAGWSLGVAALAGLAVALLASPVERLERYDPLVLGSLLGLLCVGARGLVVPIETGPTGPAVGVLVGLVVLTHLVTAVVVYRNTVLPLWSRHALGASMLLVGLFHVAAVGPASTSAVHVVAGVLPAVVGATWAAVAIALVRTTVHAQKARASALEGELLDVEQAARDVRERLHEVRSTLCGLTSASQLAHDPEVAPEVRARLESTICSELARLDRLVSGRPEEAAAQNVDLDAALGRLLHLHLAQGRTVDWHPSGAHVQACEDDVVEAVNILLDNAAAHGGGPSRIDVTSESDAEQGEVVRISVADDGPGIPPELRGAVFDWGKGRAGSPGQGIGLNLAQRLVSEQGGSLTLADDRAQGSEFVIRLPAVRRSPE